MQTKNLHLPELSLLALGFLFLYPHVCPHVRWTLGYPRILPDSV